MNLQTISMRKFLPSEKNFVSADALYESFMKEFSRCYTISDDAKDKYYEFIKNIANLDDENYKLWFKELGKTKIEFIKDNIELVTQLVGEDKKSLLPVAYTMYTKEKSLVNRSLPAVNTSTVFEKKEELKKEYDKIVLSISINARGNIAEKIKEELIRLYQSFESDPILGKYYHKLLFSVEKDTLEQAKLNLKRIPLIVEKKYEKETMNYIVDRAVITQRSSSARTNTKVFCKNKPYSKKN